MKVIRQATPRLPGRWQIAVVGISFFASSFSVAQPVLPGTGQKIDFVGDDFEDPNWRFSFNHPKSSRNINKKENGPLGQSQNGRWLEGPHRGTPDVLRRVVTPDGGLEGSEGSLLMQTLSPGIPNRTTDEPQQDDIMIKVRRRFGRPIPPDWSPNCIVRVFVPPFDEWEQRNGTSFGFRIDCWGKKPGEEGKDVEQYWPGIFINLQPARYSRDRQPKAYLTVRSDVRGRDTRGPEVQPGWLTLGMSVSPDGMCHFYARQGIDDLRPEDRLASYYCYGYRCERFDLIFFNVVAFDNGRTWSTPWVIDDPTFYCSQPLASRLMGQARRR